MELELYEDARGPCIVCGKESKGSRYWLRMTAAQWAIIRPLVAPLYPANLVQDILFVPQLNRPLCGPICSSKFKERTDGAR